MASEDAIQIKDLERKVQKDISIAHFCQEQIDELLSQDSFSEEEVQIYKKQLQETLLVLQQDILKLPTENQYPYQQYFSEFFQEGSQ